MCVDGSNHQIKCPVMKFILRRYNNMKRWVILVIVQAGRVSLHFTCKLVGLRPSSKPNIAP